MSAFRAAFASFISEIFDFLSFSGKSYINSSGTKRFRGIKRFRLPRVGPLSRDAQSDY
jgi:hypothetical protein